MPRRLFWRAPRMRRMFCLVAGRWRLDMLGFCRRSGVAVGEPDRIGESARQATQQMAILAAEYWCGGKLAVRWASGPYRAWDELA